MSPCRFRGLGPYPLPNTVVPLAQPHHVAPWPISFQLEHIWWKANVGEHHAYIRPRWILPRWYIVWLHEL